MSVFVVRTDLALEEGERIRESGVEIHGVILEEETRPETGILVTRVKIETKNGAKIMGKPIGTYVTLEAGQLGNDEEEYQQEVAKELSMQLQKLIPDPETEKSVLVVGLGNRQVTADALGPRVADRLFINRHIILEFGAAAYNRKKMNRVSCLVPGVEHFADTDALLAALPGLLQPGDSVLIKASHGMGYAKIVEALEK